MRLVGKVRYRLSVDDSCYGREENRRVGVDGDGLVELGEVHQLGLWVACRRGGIEIGRIDCKRDDMILLLLRSWSVDVCVRSRGDRCNEANNSSRSDRGVGLRSRYGYMRRGVQLFEGCRKRGLAEQVCVEVVRGEAIDVCGLEKSLPDHTLSVNQVVPRKWYAGLDSGG